VRGLAIVAVICACARDVRVGPTDIATSQLHAAPPTDGSDFTRAWDIVSTGANDRATAGEWRVQRDKDGAIRVERQIERVAGHDASDRTIDANVRERLMHESGVPKRDLDLDVTNHVVSLHGMVESAGAARRVVELALGTRGVDGVISYLHW
jgi:hypothetical protein